MTQEEKRIAIAEACGWIRDERCDNWKKPSEDEFAVAFMDGSPMRRQLPDYFGDLNAAHEMEKSMTVDQAWIFTRHLSDLLGVSGGMGSGSVDEWPWHATAAQRAEAFGKALNLW